MKNLLLSVLLACTTSSAAGETLATDLKPFTAPSMEEIESRYREQPFLVALWSVTCQPCMHELTMLGKWRRQNPEIPLVLIATDGLEHSAAIKEKLAQLGLTTVDNWVFAENYVEKLRYNIDPAWHGELPRSYFYSPSSKRIAVSGAITRDQIESWQASLTESGQPEQE